MEKRSEKNRTAVDPVSSLAPVVFIDPSAVDARYQLLAAMTWPRSRQRRNEALATFAALHMNEAELEVAAEKDIRQSRISGGVTAADVAATRLKAIENEVFKPAGGIAAVAKGVGIDQISRQIARTVLVIVPQVGGILHFAAQLDRHHPDIGASLRRAWEVLEAENHPNQPRATAERGKRKVQDDISAFRRTIWNEWACNAPLYAAYTRARTLYRVRDMQLHGKCDEVFPEWSEEEIGIILGWAKWFRRWATGFVQLRSTNKKAFLPCDEAVIVTTTAPELEPQLDPLSPERLKAARSYHWSG